MDEQIQSAIKNIQSVYDGYRPLIWRIARGCIMVVCAVTLNLVVINYVQQTFIKIVLWVLTVVSIGVLFHGVQLIINILRERRRIKKMIEKIYASVNNGAQP